MGYADPTGNVWLSLATPALFVEAQGEDRGPAPDTRSIRSLKGAASGRVVRGLLDRRPPYTITQLKDRIGVPLASIYRVIDFLESEAILAREPRGPVAELDWRALLARWTNDHGFTSSNRTGTFLDPRGARSALDKLRIVHIRFAVTGSMAAMGPRAVPGRLLAVYVGDRREATKALDLREVESGADIILAEPFDEVALERTRPASRTPPQLGSLQICSPGPAVAAGGRGDDRLDSGERGCLARLNPNTSSRGEFSSTH